MSCLDPANFQKLMYDRETAIHEEILGYFSKLDDVWNKDVVIPSGVWTEGDGYLREKVRHHMGPNPQLDHSELWSAVTQSIDENEVPVGDEDYDESLAHSNCDQGTCHDLEIGLEKFTYRPKQSCLKGPKICAEDIRYSWKFAQIMDKHTQSYMQAVASHKSRWNRDTYIGLSQRFPAQEGYEYLNPVPGVLPTIPAAIELLPLSIGLLDARYPALSIEAQQWATGRTTTGGPVFTVLLPPEDITQLARDTLGQEAFRNQGTSILAEVQQQGIGTAFAIGNWAFKADMYGNRFKRHATTGAFIRVTPFGSEDANITGKRWRVSQEYVKAPYAEAVILMKDVFKNLIFQPLASVGGGSRLGSADNGLISWDGAPIWTYVPTECDPYGLTGNYRFHFKRAAEPLSCDLSYTIIYKRCPYSQVQTACVTGTGCDTREACDASATVWACSVSGSVLTLIASKVQPQLTVGTGVSVVVAGVGSAIVGSVTEVNLDGVFEYKITRSSGGAAGCGTGITSVTVT